jgi:hypothetical protein
MTTPVALETQIVCVEREIRQRHRVYPRLVERGTMKQHQADAEIAAMNAVLQTLLALRGAVPTQAPLL